MTIQRICARILLVLVWTLAISGCWFPLPEETALVVDVLDSLGRPVNDVQVLIDGQALVTGQDGNEGSVFQSLGSGGIHVVSIESDSLQDPQGGRSQVPLAYQVSGGQPIAYADLFAAASTPYISVPVANGLISVVTIYLADMLQAPLDNQWLTDGNSASNWRGTENGQDEFLAQPRPRFWWRTDPSLAGTVVTTFQLWQDQDGDVRYPLGVRDHVGYIQAMDPNQAVYRQPHWQIPNAGLQKAEGLGSGRVRLHAGVANGADRYDVYFAPIVNWQADIDSNPVLSDVNLSSSPFPDLVLIDLGPGTTNPGIFLRNGIDYTFALRARDTASNLDRLQVATARTSRRAVPRASAPVGSVNSVSVWDTDNGGQLTLLFQCSANQSLRVYAAPSVDWVLRPFDPRFLRETTTCAPGSNFYTLDGLVSRAAGTKRPVSYIVGLEPFDSANNVGAAGTVLGTPTSRASAETVQPFWANGGSIIPTTTGQPGQVRVTFDAVNDAGEISTYFYRLYFGPASLSASNDEARAHMNIQSNAGTAVTFGDIPTGTPWRFAIQALDIHGNGSTIKSAQITLFDPLGGDGPYWSTDTQSLFASVGYPAPGVATHPLGVVYDYNGPALTTSETGEYVWRVVQDNGDPAQKVESKLGAFYSWSGFYYATSLIGGLNMGNPSVDVRQRDVFNFVERSLSRSSVMGAYFDSNADDGYRQRTVRGFLSMLESGSNDANQLALRYVADEDGVVTDVGLDTSIPPDGRVDAYGALLELTAINSQYVDRALSSYPPHLQRKALLTLYREDQDEMFFFPGSALGVSFNGSLATPDSLDPEW